MSDASPRKVLVLGASGLIGRFVTDDLRSRGFKVVGAARAFSPAQKRSVDDHDMPIMAMDANALAFLFADRDIDCVVNCLGVLQDGPGSDTSDVHRGFVERLIEAIRRTDRKLVLVHISMPGDASEDHTAFSRTKREAEQLIAASGLRYAILRPGFVIAPAAYGGSAMLRALAAFPFDLPEEEAATRFQPVAVQDIATTIAWLAEHGVPETGIVWDLMQPQLATLGDVIDAFRIALGTAHITRVRTPLFLIDLGAKLGDATSWLGWMSPMRSTAIAELRRGVRGDPSAWMAATGINPMTLDQTVGRHPATIQDIWFARLFLIKALIIAALGVFWIASGFIALFVSYDAAAGILVAHKFPAWIVAPMTIGTSLMDMTIGCLIVLRRTSRWGLIFGIVASLGYMFGSAILAPDLWIEPLGALVKTGPAIVLMLVALLMSDNR
ncbi:MAG: nucleoside-diphosphate sugar epimerase [Proteobacteria bacterium SG_bin9]|nr:MAG: nucleoside-diphosphate sugar epimerase [Proteobacteria bacterium SG_bin9]